MQATVITALQFGPGMPSTGLPVELNTESSEALLCSLDDGPVAYVVRLEQLPALRRLKDVVADFGERDPRQQLWRELRRKTQLGVKLIDGKYQKIYWLLKAISSVLSWASEEGERRRLVIGADVTLFDQLLEIAEQVVLERRRRPDAADALGLPWRDRVPPEIEEKVPGVSTAAQQQRVRMARAIWYKREVLLVGECGTPLEAVARAIHAQRSHSPFLAVYCAVNGDRTFEALLCGGGATSADSRRDAVPELARLGGGTLYVDSVSELRPRRQVQLLHALEWRAMRTTAGILVPMAAHVIAASRCDLKELVDTGRFNAELYHRLRPFTIRVPSLRDRPEDIAPIALAVWRDLVSDSSVTLPYDVEQALREYEWPGNHVQLEGVLCTLHRWCGTRRPTAAHVRCVLQDYDAPLFDRPLQPRRRPSGRDD